MKRVLIDTNVLVSFLTDRDLVQQEKAAKLLARAAARELEVVLHLVAATETVYVLQNLYGVPPEQAAAALKSLLALPGLVAVCDLDWSRLLDLWPGRIPAFADAALAAAARANRCDAVATFDVGLARRLRREGLGVHG